MDDAVRQKMDGVAVGKSGAARLTPTRQRVASLSHVIVHYPHSQGATVGCKRNGMIDTQIQSAHSSIESKQSLGCLRHIYALSSC